ncbi:hybrid-cluster NAD(P)-dependent oxidoreductase [Neisseriaceae bacterium PsAf]|nr:hybrid-cluster NAD(P)-dependent oxidoreductase [Neisseriaceae bacterium PsAf]
MSQTNIKFPRELKLVKKIPETPNAVSFYFESKDKSVINFKPGQFILIEVEIEKEKHYRAYSLCSLPSDRLLQIMVKRVKNGLISNWMIDNLEENMTINCLGVEGSFNIVDTHPKDKILLISAGCGITPNFAMLKYLLTSGNQSDIRLLHCAPNTKETVFINQIYDFKDKYDNFDYQFLFDEWDNQVKDKTKASLERFSTGLLEAYFGSIHDYSIYVCGPDGFMQIVKKDLQESGFDTSHYFQELFKSENLSPICDYEIKEPSLVTVKVPDFNFEQEVPVGFVLVDVLEKGGVPIITACRSGICGSFGLFEHY